MPAPVSLRLERAMMRGPWARTGGTGGRGGLGGGLVAGMDEVGRGALSGPVTVGVVVVAPGCRPAPRGLADSKALSANARIDLVPRIVGWAHGAAVGHASAAEIDAVGVTAALRLAGHRALAALVDAPADVLLDGGHDYLTGPGGSAPRVRTLVRADRSCASVAAASVLAKVARDAIMVDLAGSFPEYGWAANKGYGTPDHLDALARLGPVEHHRRTWRLPAPRG